MPVLCLAGLKSCVINYFQPFLWCQSLLPLIWTSDILSSSKIRQKTLCIIQSGIVNDRPCWCFFTLSEPYVCTWCQSWWFSDTPQFKPFEQITPFLLRNTIRAFHCSSMKLSQILPSFSKLVMTFECGTKVKKWLCLLIGTHYLRNSCGRRRRLSQRIKELFVILVQSFCSHQVLLNNFWHRSCLRRRTNPPGLRYIYSFSNHGIQVWFILEFNLHGRYF